MMFSQHIRRPIQLISILGALAILGGCASGATKEGMTTVNFEAPTKHAKTVSVKVSGGQETSPTGRAQISDEAFTAALVDSINKSKTFSQVVQGKGGDYELGVNIISLDRPTFGASFTVKMEAGWSLKKASTGEVVLQKVIKSEHTATMSDAMVGATRMLLAIEGAARNNITQGLTEISQLKL